MRFYEKSRGYFCLFLFPPSPFPLSLFSFSLSLRVCFTHLNLFQRKCTKMLDFFNLVSVDRGEKCLCCRLQFRWKVIDHIFTNFLISLSLSHSVSFTSFQIDGFRRVDVPFNKLCIETSLNSSSSLLSISWNRNILK